MTPGPDDSVLQPVLELLRQPDPQPVRQGLALLLALDTDGQLHDALIEGCSQNPPEKYPAHGWDIQGPLAEVCVRQITAFDDMIDDDYTDEYTFPELLLQVLMQSPGGRSAQLRQSLETLDLSYTPPTSEPAERFDLRILQAFPRLAWLHLEYPCDHWAVLSSLPLTQLSIESPRDTPRDPDRVLDLPSQLLSLSVKGPGPDIDLRQTPHLEALELDAAAAPRLRHLTALTQLRRVNFGIAPDTDFAAAVPATLQQNHPSLESIDVGRLDQLHLPGPFPRLRRLDVQARDVQMGAMPTLERLRLWTQGFCLPQLPALQTATLREHIDLTSLRDSTTLVELILESPSALIRDFPPLPALQSLRLHDIKDLSFVPAYPSLTSIRFNRRTDIETLPAALQPLARPY